MIDSQIWMPEVQFRLKQTFGDRLHYLGLQGSYRRGEATECSDIDLVVLLDAVTLDDLDVYRHIVHSMPEGHKACGFISSVKELSHWPRHELFLFKMDTIDIHGTLDDFLPHISRNDISAGARIGASTLYHMLVHSYLYASADTKPAILKEAYKSAFFIMLVIYYMLSGVYCRSKQDLHALLNGTEKEILTAELNFPAWLAAHSEKEAYDLLLYWCRDILNSENISK